MSATRGALCSEALEPSAYSIHVTARKAFWKLESTHLEVWKSRPRRGSSCPKTFSQSWYQTSSSQVLLLAPSIASHRPRGLPAELFQIQGQHRSRWVPISRLGIIKLGIIKRPLSCWKAFSLARNLLATFRNKTNESDRVKNDFELCA
jgi:hypothetical protein